MKILIGFLIALFISSQAYAQSATEVINKGKILTIINTESGLVWYHIIYKSEYYYCLATSVALSCKKPKDYGSKGLERRA